MSDANKTVGDIDPRKLEMPPVRVSPWSCSLRVWLLCLAIFGIVLGIRMALITRFGTSMPIADEWNFREVVEEWFKKRDWHLFFQRYNGQHFLFTAYLSRALSTWANGLWEARVQSVIHSLAYAALAVSSFLLLRKTAKGSGTLAIAFGTLVVFAIPFAGYRATQAVCDYLTYVMLFASLTAHLVGAQRLGYLRGLAVCALVFLATFSAGSGCLLGFSVAAILGIRMLQARKITPPEAIAAAFSFALFAWAMITMPSSGGAAPPKIQAMKALLSGLAWPNTFFAPAAFLASLPVAMLGIRFLRIPACRSRSIEAVLLMAAFVFLQCAAMGIFRGDNGNFGMPSGRYNDIVIFVGLLNFTALLILARELPAHRGIHLLRFLWMGLTVAGCAVHFLWRTWPFLARENGEWYEWAKQDAARQFVETKDPRFIPELAEGRWDETSDISGRPEFLRSILSDAEPATMLTQGSLVGIPLKASVVEGFEEKGYPKPYYAIPHYKYWGSYTRARENGIGTFVSEPFIPATGHLCFSIVVNKKARFSGYRLDGLSLSLLETGTGQEIPLLPQLRTRFPSIFRDQEIVSAPVQMGAKYVVKAVDASASEWFAFSQPWEGGRLTGITQAMLDSGKLMILCGALLFVVAIFPRLEKADPPVK